MNYKNIFGCLLVALLSLLPFFSFADDYVDGKTYGELSYSWIITSGSNLVVNSLLASNAIDGCQSAAIAVSGQVAELNVQTQTWNAAAGPREYYDFNGANGTNMRLSYVFSDSTNWLGLAMVGSEITNLYAAGNYNTPLPPPPDLVVTWSTNLTHPLNGDYYVAGSRAWDEGSPHTSLSNTTGYVVFYMDPESAWLIASTNQFHWYYESIDTNTMQFSRYAVAGYCTYPEQVVDSTITVASRVPVIIYGTNDYCGDYEEVATNILTMGDVVYYQKAGTPTWYL